MLYLANKKHNVDKNRTEDTKEKQAKTEKNGIFNQAFNSDELGVVEGKTCHPSHDMADQAEVDIGITKSLHCTSKLWPIFMTDTFVQCE